MRMLTCKRFLTSKPTGASDAGGRSERKAALNSNSQSPSRQLVELLSKALLDREFRDKLFANREAITRAFDLNPDEARMVKHLNRERFEQRVARLRSA